LSNEDPKSLTTIYLPVRCKTWIKEHGYSFSRFVREAVEEKIGRESGYQSQIKKYEQKIRSLEEELEKARKTLGELKKRQVEWEKEQKRKERRRIIARAIAKVRYKNVKEAAYDLRELGKDLSWEEWLKEVEEVWEEHENL